jgi:hypothetical protein
MASKVADWRNYNRSFVQHLICVQAVLRTLMKDARGGPIR